MIPDLLIFSVDSIQHYAIIRHEMRSYAMDTVTEIVTDDYEIPYVSLR